MHVVIYCRLQHTLALPVGFNVYVVPWLHLGEHPAPIAMPPSDWRWSADGVSDLRDVHAKAQILIVLA